MGKVLCAVLTVAVLCGVVAAHSENPKGTEKPGNTIIVAKAEGKTCPYCGEENLPDAVWCWKCGKKLPEKKAAQRYCPYCRAQINADAKFCPECGRSLKGAESESARRYRRTGLGPTGQSGLGAGLGVAFGGGSTSGNAGLSFDFGIGDYVAIGPEVHLATAFNELGVSYGVGLGARFYPIPHFAGAVQPYVGLAFGYLRSKAEVIYYYGWWAETEIRNANTIAADASFGIDFEIPNTIVAPFVGVVGGVNHISVSGLELSDTKGVFGLGGGVRLGIW